MILIIFDPDIQYNKEYALFIAKIRKSLSIRNCILIYQINDTTN